MTQKQRATFLTQVEARLVAARPELAGRLDWDTLIHLYNIGTTVEETVTRYLAKEAK